MSFLIVRFSNTADPGSNASLTRNVTSLSAGMRLAQSPAGSRKAQPM
jgi:hypothetical protein